MSRQSLIRRFPWKTYSKKLTARIDRPHSVGTFAEADAKARGMRLVCGHDGSIADGNYVQVQWLVDPEDGVVVDARFQAFGQSALIGAAEASCELVVGKNYDQAHKLVGADFIDKHLRDRDAIPAFPPETYPHLNLVVGAVDMASQQCTDIPLAIGYVSPVPSQVGEVLEGGYPGWDTFDLKQKITIINQVLDEHVRPYIALDDGGVEVINLLNDRELIIAYQGNCTSCFSAVGATLSYIQQTLQAKVHPDLVVVPDMPDGFMAP